MKPIVVSGAIPKKLEREKMQQEKPALIDNKAKSIFKRIADIVVDGLGWYGLSIRRRL